MNPRTLVSPMNCKITSVATSDSVASQPLPHSIRPMIRTASAVMSSQNQGEPTTKSSVQFMTILLADRREDEFVQPGSEAAHSAPCDERGHCLSRLFVRSKRFLQGIASRIEHFRQLFLTHP